MYLINVQVTIIWESDVTHTENTGMIAIVRRVGYYIWRYISVTMYFMVIVEEK